jgi:molecular chaperone DnaK (HSP70)
MNGDSSRMSVYRDEMLARGAAIQAGSEGGHCARPFPFLRIRFPHTIGVESIGGKIEEIAVRNSCMHGRRLSSCRKRVYCRPVGDYEGQARLRLFEGESLMAQDNQLIDDFVLQLPAPAKGSSMSISANVDPDGCVSARVTAESRIELDLDDSVLAVDRQPLDPRIDQARAEVLELLANDERIKDRKARDELRSLINSAKGKVQKYDKRIREVEEWLDGHAYESAEVYERTLSKLSMASFHPNASIKQDRWSSRTTHRKSD